MSRLITIKAPKYFINGYTYNEYEIRKICYMVLKGELQPGIKVKDSYGVVATIDEKGTLSKNLYGMDISAKLAFSTFNLTYSK